MGGMPSRNSVQRIRLGSAALALCARTAQEAKLAAESLAVMNGAHASPLAVLLRGEAAARAFVDDGAREVAWTLTGPEANDFRAVAAMLTEELGRPIRYVPASIAGSLWHQRVRRRRPLGEATVITVLHTLLRSSADPVDPTLERVLGRRPRTVRDTIRDFAALWRR